MVKYNKYKKEYLCADGKYRSYKTKNALACFTVKKKPTRTKSTTTNYSIKQKPTKTRSSNTNTTKPRKSTRVKNSYDNGQTEIFMFKLFIVYPIMALYYTIKFFYNLIIKRKG